MQIERWQIVIFCCLSFKVLGLELVPEELERVDLGDRPAKKKLVDGYKLTISLPDFVVFESDRDDTTHRFTSYQFCHSYSNSGFPSRLAINAPHDYCFSALTNHFRYNLNF